MRVSESTSCSFAEASLDALWLGAEEAFAGGERVVFGYDAAAGYVIADSDGNQEAGMVIKLAGIRSDTRIAAIDFVFSDPVVV